MLGSLQVRPGEVRGWAFDPEAAATSVEVRLRLGEQVIGEARAALPRPDVAKTFGVTGDHGFRLPLALSEADAPRVVAEARSAPDGPWQKLGRPPARRGGRGHGQYQSFDDAPGGSRSAEKLEALRLSLLPNRHDRGTPLKGLSVLDLGCNEGFFCGEALRQGARRVVGIDSNDGFLERARARFPAAEFRSGSWWDAPDEKFDVILFLSAIHYEPDPAGLLRMLAGHLAPGGTLVIECGIAQGRGSAWRTVTRVEGVRRYPTFDLFVGEICQPFATRIAGASVSQRGDPVPRRVFHCALKESMALIVAGPSRSGKTTLAREFGQHDIPVVSTDRLLVALLREPRHDGTPLGTVARRFLPEAGLNRIGAALAAERPGEFVELLLSELPLGPEMICIEGEILRHRSVSDLLQRGLSTRGVRTWIIAARRPSPTRAFASRIGAAVRGVVVSGRVAVVRRLGRRRPRPATEKP